jgi:predicted metalloprotease with PDZ domain
MRRWRECLKRGGASLILMLALFTLALSQSRIEYTLTVPPVEAQRFQIAIRVPHPEGKPLRFAIPAWCPGWHLLMDYETDILNLRARGKAGQPLAVQQTGKREWTIADPDPEETVLEYEVRLRGKAYSLFRSYLEEDEAFVNGPSCFLYLNGQKQTPITLTIRAHPDWKIATGLAPTEQPNVFTASDYDELIDCPLQLGRFWQTAFTLSGVRFEVVIAGSPTPRTRDRWVEELKAVAETTLSLTRRAPFKRYLFIIQAQNFSFMGGLEHRNSTVLNVGANSPSIAQLAAHELFHAWNVKHFRPAVLGPFDYTREARTQNLWFAEGVTEYYAYLIVRRAGLIDEQHFLNALALEIEQLQRNPNRLKVSLAECSERVWEARNSIGYGGLNYYNKGCVVGLLLDLKLRAITGNRRSLDDLMRLLMERYGYPKPGYPEDGLLKAYSELAGQDMSAFYRRLVNSVEELPYQEVFGEVGLELVQEAGRYRLRRAANLTPAQQQLLDSWLAPQERPSPSRIE